MSILNVTTRIGINPEVQSTLVDHEMIILPNQALKMYGLNSIGRAIYVMLEEKPLSLGEICQYLVERYQVSQEQCFTEMSQFIQRMLDLYLLTVSE